MKTHPEGSSTPRKSSRASSKGRPSDRARQSRQQLERRLAVNVGEEARSARMRAGLTQADVAERIGIAAEVYGRMERGKMMPSVPTLFRLCLALRLSADVGLGLVTAASVGAALWEEDSRDKDHLPEMRRLLRTLRRMSRGQLKLVNQVAAAILPQR
ncbi:helix-turn-helix domain-containing protein [Myxococcus guangdongensis]|uniref:helix-turn-helix domain-containing protein n=1 Tax=Myxococcus guangdongensis TaxID=2906760 RepID=UPI002B20F3BC|nr:helix-turn-helix transcriptional regulator [Myxococcus guangdongensis]